MARKKPNPKKPANVDGEIDEMMYYEEDIASTYLELPEAIPHEEEIHFWIEALDRLDRLGDKKPLTELLRSECYLSPIVRGYLADLIERGVPKPHSRPHTPAYKISDTNATLLWAHKNVRAYIESGLSKDDALEKVAGDWGINITTLRLSLQGRHTSLRKSKKLR